MGSVYSPIQETSNNVNTLRGFVTQGGDLTARTQELAANYPSGMVDRVDVYRQSGPTGKEGVGVNQGYQEHKASLDKTLTDFTTGSLNPDALYAALNVPQQTKLPNPDSMNQYNTSSYIREKWQQQHPPESINLSRSDFDGAYNAGLTAFKKSYDLVYGQGGTYGASYNAPPARAPARITSPEGVNNTTIGKAPTTILGRFKQAVASKKGTGGSRLK